MGKRNSSDVFGFSIEKADCLLALRYSKSTQVEHPGSVSLMPFIALLDPSRLISWREHWPTRADPGFSGGGGAPTSAEGASFLGGLGV